MVTIVAALRQVKAELAQRFQERWTIAGHFDHLKTTRGAAVLRCQTVAGVAKEPWAFVRLCNLVRQVMLPAARRQGVAPHRVRFVDALRWPACARADQRRDALILNPWRENRYEPRVRKRRKKEYPLTARPRSVRKQELTVT